MLYNAGLFDESISKIRQKFIRILDCVNIFTDDPDHGCFCFGIIKSLEVLADLFEDTFIVFWVFPEDISDYNDCFLCNIFLFGFETFPKNLYTLWSSFLKFNCATSNCADGLNKASILNVY